MRTDSRNETARAMVNHLCPWLLSHDETGQVAEEARSERAAGIERRIQRAEELHRLHFEETFDLDFFEDETDDIEDESDEEEVEDINILSQELGSQTLWTAHNFDK